MEMKRTNYPIIPNKCQQKKVSYGKRRAFIFAVRNACLVNTVTRFKNDT